MIQIIHSCLIEWAKESPPKVIIHNCNCFHTMGAGVAREIRYHFPLAYHADLQTRYADRTKLGHFSKADTNEQGILIYNLYAQYSLGSHARQLSYDALFDGIDNILKDLKENHPGVIDIGVPYKIGCDLAGGSWNIVHEFFKEKFSDSEFNLTICQKYL